MSEHYEWVSTASPFFAVRRHPEKEVLDDAGLDPDLSEGEDCLAISSDGVVVVTGDLYQFALCVVKSVFGQEAVIVPPAGFPVEKANEITQEFISRVQQRLDEEASDAQG